MTIAVRPQHLAGTARRSTWWTREKRLGRHCYRLHAMAAVGVAGAGGGVAAVLVVVARLAG